MNWLEQHTALFDNHSATQSRVATIDGILRYEFWPSLPHVFSMRKLDEGSPDYDNQKRGLKAKLQGWTPAGQCQSRKKDDTSHIRTNVLQLDFDEAAISEYDIEELKKAVFDLPFIGFCGLSCSGKGFYALALIEEPERLAEYAQHCFNVFEHIYGIKPDTTKGRNVTDLRYVSYDANMLIRDDPTPLKIKKFYSKPVEYKPQQQANYTGKTNRYVAKCLDVLANVQPGSRNSTVNSIAYAVGQRSGTQENLQTIKDIIYGNTVFADGIAEFIRCAERSYREGQRKPA
ncbi:BT4734/BF3469 family protein [Parafilimonas sp.]|uniref:BT4734/BF3469 family protein n=1 Tax=Parafilimonas sp. TaxID=1969739 RepID=UPI0039E270F5